MEWHRIIEYERHLTGTVSRKILLLKNLRKKRVSNAFYINI